MIAGGLGGCHILIVEDDFYQAMDVRESLEQAGARIVACRATIPNLDEMMARSEIDIALLDINLDDTQSFELAGALNVKGVPCVFLSGYDPAIVPADLPYARFISKPAEASHVIATLEEVYGARPRATAEGD